MIESPINIHTLWAIFGTPISLPFTPLVFLKDLSTIDLQSTWWPSNKHLQNTGFKNTPTFYFTFPSLWKLSPHIVEYFAPDSCQYWKCVNKPWTCPLTHTEKDNNTLVKHYWNPLRTSFKHVYWFKGHVCPLIHFAERGTVFRWQISISESIPSFVVIGQRTSQARIGELNIQNKQSQKEACYLFLVVLKRPGHGLRESVL